MTGVARRRRLFSPETERVECLHTLCAALGTFFETVVSFDCTGLVPVEVNVRRTEALGESSDQPVAMFLRWNQDFATHVEADVMKC